MSISEKEAIDMFIDIVDKGNCPDDSLDVQHIFRGYMISRKAPNKFQISIDRHPHLFGRPSKGISSSAFATINP
ncbi:MAG: hypothetical protein QQN41_13765 [Nitrosopumilus sp.]